MTGRPKLSVVGQQLPDAPDWRAESVMRQWEAQLVGALMHLPASKAATPLALVPDSAI